MSYRTPPNGLQSWTGPDVSAPAAAALEANLDVEVVDHYGNWVKVRCSNGWETWVDSRQLIDTSAPPAAPAAVVASKEPPWLIIAIVALVAVAVVAIGFAATRKPATDPAATTTGTTLSTTTSLAPRVNPISLDIPDGWATSDDGMVAAEQASDLQADVPKGARVRVELNVKSQPIDEQFDKALSAPAELAAEPEPTEIDGQAAIGLTLVESESDIKIVRRYLTLDTPQNDAVLFILEAPADQWDEKIKILKEVPGLK